MPKETVGPLALGFSLAFSVQRGNDGHIDQLYDIANDGPIDLSGLSINEITFCLIRAALNRESYDGVSSRGCLIGQVSNLKGVFPDLDILAYNPIGCTPMDLAHLAGQASEYVEGNDITLECRLGLIWKVSSTAPYSRDPDMALEMAASLLNVDSQRCEDRLQSVYYQKHPQEGDDPESLISFDQLELGPSIMRRRRT